MIGPQVLNLQTTPSPAAVCLPANTFQVSPPHGVET